MRGHARRSHRSPLAFNSREEIADYAMRGTILWARVSTSRQARNSTNSKQMQMDAAWAFVAELGIPREVVTPYWAFGESGRTEAAGTRYAEVVELIQQDRVGLIVVHEYHRMARKLLRAARLFDVAAKYGVRFWIAGQLKDPANVNDLFFMQSIANGAEWQLSSQAQWNADAAFVAAQETRYRIILPSGMCWACDEDPAYREAMEKAGLSNWLDKERLSKYKARSFFDGRTYYPLPIPDRDVFHSMQLRFQWLQETRSVHRVRDRIESGARFGWPAGHDGDVPVMRTVRWRVSDSIHWAPVSRPRLYNWFRNPMLFGIYSFYSTAVEPRRLGTLRIGRRKGVHYARAIQQLRDPLPTVHALLDCSNAEEHVAPPEIVREH